jgi:hypothetical protein
MNKRVAGTISIILIILCIAYIVYDVATGRSERTGMQAETVLSEVFETEWRIIKELKISEGSPMAIAVNQENGIVCGGDTFLSAYNNNFQQLWTIETREPIYALAVSNDTVYACTKDKVVLYSTGGKELEEWGPYDDEAILTGISANRNRVAIADAGNKLVFVTDKMGALKSIVGHPGNQFIIPSAYFDVHLTEDDSLVVANTGKRRIEYRTIDGSLVRFFGEEGDSLKQFCGCCNPSHFTISSDGRIITAEKGINRIKVLDNQGHLIEAVAKPAKFMASIPLDIAIGKDNTLWGVNRFDSTVYVFKREEE